MHFIEEGGWFKTGLARLEIVFAQNGNYVPHHTNGVIVSDGSGGQRQEWEAYIASLPKRRFYRKRSILTFELRGDPALDFEDGVFLPNVTRDQIRIAAGMIRGALLYAQSTLKRSDGVDLSQLVIAADQLIEREWRSDDAMRADLKVAYDIDRARVDAMDPWAKIDMSGFHADARRVLDKPSDWSESDEFSPHGNDLGADILNNWRVEVRRTVEAVATSYEIDLEGASEYASLDRIRLMLALAFGHVKKSGKCPIELANRALDTVAADRLNVTRMVGPEHLTSWNAACDRYERILRQLAR